MRTFSPSIDAVLALAEAEGNGIAEISAGWEKTRQVVHMTGPMSRAVRQAGEGDPKLRFWTDDGSPHYWANTGFIDGVELVAIEFPRAR